MNKQLVLMTIGVSLVTAGFIGPHRFTTTLFAEVGQPDKGFLSVGIIYAVSTFVSLLAAPLISRFGAKRTFFWSSLLYGLYVLFLQGTSTGFLFLFSILLGVASALFWNAQSIYLVKYSHKNRRGKSSGFFNAIFNAVSLVGVIGFGYLFEQSAVATHRQILIAFSVLSFLGSLVIAFLPHQSFTTIPFRNQLKKIFRTAASLSILPVLLAWSVSGYIAGFSITVLPLLLKDYWSPAVVGVWISLFWGAPILFSYFSGWLSDRYGSKGIMTIGLALIILGAAGLFFTTPLTLILSSIVLPLGFSSIRTISYVQLGEVAIGSTFMELNSLLWIVTTAGALLPIILGLFGFTRISIAGLLILAFLSLFFFTQIKQDEARR
ncbi:MAG: MFS transporter [Parcubacteria group bacterium]|nr:MFS transporter [Parcubacteria group bacterium]